MENYIKMHHADVNVNVVLRTSLMKIFGGSTVLLVIILATEIKRK